MKKSFYIILLLLCCIIFPKESYAEQWYKGQKGCSYSEINRLRTLAGAVKFEAKYLGNKRNNEYGVQISNVSNDLDVYFNDTKVDTSKVFDDLYPSTYITFTVRVTKSNACYGLLEMSKKIDIPAHNYYYDEELCEGASDLEICDPNYDSTQITYSEFKQRIEIHKSSSSTKKTNKFLEFSKKYWYVYVISIVLIGFIIFILIKTKKKRGILSK